MTSAKSHGVRKGERRNEMEGTKQMDEMALPKAKGFCSPLLQKRKTIHLDPDMQIG